MLTSEFKENLQSTVISQKDSLEANIGRSLAKVLAEHAVLVVSGFKMAPRPGIFTIIDIHRWMCR